MTEDEDIIADIAVAEETLRDALAELVERVDQGKYGDATNELVRHCREMAEILQAALIELGNGPDEDATRTAVDHLLGSLVDLELAVRRDGLH